MRSWRRAPARALSRLLPGLPPGLLPGALCCALLWAGAAAGCGASSSAGGARAGADAAVVLVQSNVPDAELWIDGRFVGLVGTLAGGVSLAPGAHRVEVRHALYHTFYQLIEVPPRATEVLDVALVPVLP